MAAQHSRYGDYSTRYRFNGKEQDEATGFYYYGARYYAPSLSRWLSTDPLAEKYQGFSPYNYTLNNPINLVDPDGRSVDDIIFLLDREKAHKNGHMAVLIGDEKNGWTYYSINGTGEGARMYGFSKDADKGTSIVDGYKNKILNMKKAIIAANNINVNEEHSYDGYKRIKTSNSEDKNAGKKVKKVTETTLYGIAGPGKSCIDTAQEAFKSVVEDRDLDAQFWKIFKDNISGEDDLIPNNWFDKLEKRIEAVNKNKTNNSNPIKIISKGKINYEKTD